SQDFNDSAEHGILYFNRPAWCTVTVQVLAIVQYQAFPTYRRESIPSRSHPLVNPCRARHNG
ncbi:MAG: hypothetical protein QGH11_11960, partial [Pirellulaceae bacterium]|nr:hypothetical protein [Pirellulaceae bacterium]